MAWKDLSSWLKGGVIGLLLLLLIFIIIKAVNLITYPYGWLIGEVLEEFYLFNALYDYQGGFAWFGLIKMIIKWFGIGALIGWIVGKFREK